LRKDYRGVDLIPDARRSVSCDTASQTRLATQSDLQSISADHMMRRSAFDTRAHPTNIHSHVMKRLFHCKDCADDFCFHLI
jgi:hypothetical protein